jgi:hypothetical protein
LGSYHVRKVDLGADRIGYEINDLRLTWRRLNRPRYRSRSHRISWPTFAPALSG